MGYISPAEIPKIAPGVTLSDNEVDSIIIELKTLANTFKPSEKNNTAEDLIAEDEELSDAGERLKSAKEKIDHIDDILARLRG